MTDSPTDYDPSPTTWVRKHVEAIETAGTTDVAHIMDRPVVLLTMRGARSGRSRRVPLMRVEHDGTYAAVASKGGAPEHPVWYHNLSAHPRITIQDGTTTTEVVAREISGREREEWWPRCVSAFPSYAEYQTRTDRLIPVFLLEPSTSS